MPNTLLWLPLLAISLIPLSAGCSFSTPSPTLTILVAASAADAITEAAEIYQRQSGIQIRVSSGPSNALAQQIIAGAPADIFISANRKWSDELSKRNLTKSAVDLFTNQMVLIVPSDHPTTISNLAEATAVSSALIAIAGEQVPAGIYAEQILRSAGSYKPLEATQRLVRGSDARVTVSYVERGEVDAGIVYATDANSTTRVKIVESFAPGMHDTVAYTASALSDSRNSQGATALLAFLQTQSAIWKSYGFQE